MNGHVRILHYNENAAAMIASGGRISTMDGTAEEIYAKSISMPQEKNEKLIGKVLSSGHTSVLEHTSVNLAFENVSVFVEQFIIEFRLASFTVKSRRYVDFSNAGYFMPDFSDCPEAASVYRDTADALFACYDRLCAAGVPKEDARFVLPYCFFSNFFCTMNARELVHVMNEMVYGRGARYPEIKALGESLFAQCEKYLPYLAIRKSAEYQKPAFRVPAGERLTPEQEVTVLSATPDAESVICNAALARFGYAPRTLSDAERAEILKSLLSQNRKRELEQVSFTLLYRGLSLSALTHLTRHRMQSLVAPELLSCVDDEKYVLPQTVIDCGMEQDYRAAFRLAAEAKKRLACIGVPSELLNYLLVSGLTVPVVCTMNAGELFTYLRLRTCSRAQWEIRQASTEALKELRRVSPLLFSFYGPTCFCTGKCPEGKMCCGKTEEIRRRFSGNL